ncbi:hypothetical protein [Paenibacillus turpanensis]|uniref:hypothetical protein n=1 Tax=Paenibacillus turpanensis TaxID=2689078 RepID=UPI00140B0291|nr:hypothetical protein [Paenibacillus turpanensis]
MTREAPILILYNKPKPDVAKTECDSTKYDGIALSFNGFGGKNFGSSPCMYVKGKGKRAGVSGDLSPYTRSFKINRKRSPLFGRLPK